MKNNTRKIIRLIGIAFIVVALGFFGWDYYVSSKSRAMNQELSDLNKQIIDDLLPDQESLSEEEILQLRLTRLNQEYLQRNDDYIGWISIENTVIDYPMVQANDNDFYMRRGFDKQRLQHGSIFMDYRNNNDLSDVHTVIYGHAMLDGTMFRALDKYQSKDFYLEHQTIEVRTLYDYRTYRIFAAYLVDATKQGLDIPANNMDVQTLVSRFKNQSRYATDVDTNDIDHILTLVSCNYDIDNGRIIVHAVLEDVVSFTD